jgi:hypothetical protein
MKEKKKHTGFRTPDGYFEEFEYRLFSKLSEGNIPKETGFKTPEGYFNQLDDRIIQHVESFERKAKVIPLFTRKTLLYAASIAACAILVFSLMDGSQSITQIEDIEISSIEIFIDEGLLGYEINDVTALMEKEDFTEFNPIDDQLSEESLEEYLIKSIDDTTLLIE